MALTPTYIADKSALEQLKHPAVSALLEPLILGGEVATCGIIEMEVLFSARTHRDLVERRARRLEGFQLIPMLQQDLDRATDVMQELAKKGMHRAASLPDLLIAALAERARLTVLHYDADYDHIASVTGQPVQWIAPRGSL